MVFEFSVPEDQMEEYMLEATELRPHLAKIDGFISVERFASTVTPGKFVAVGYFENEDAVTEWRNTPEHRHVQGLGRKKFFSRYRLVMSEVVRDYSHQLREEAPEDSKKIHGD